MTGDDEGPRALARALAEARAEGRKLDAPPGPDPQSWEAAYAIQDALIAVTESPVVGWKIGATSKTAQDRLGVDGPFIGPLFERWATDSPAAIATPAHALRIVEPEFAFRMAVALPPRDAPYSQDEVRAAAGTLHPAFELIDRRIRDQPAVGAAGTDGFAANPFWFVADCGANAAFVLGEGTADWAAFDLAALGVTVTIDGAAKTRGTGAAAMGGPLAALTWAANHLSTRGIGLKAGDVVTTGVVTEIFALQPGQTADAEFEALGVVSVEMGEY
ncbi:MAG: hypothetical protein RIB45_04500 [Marivibrio sp.]|uniref:2-keto-4-pentenoate hydratase n=1 Tax=Marivibrio sp. TaxID=2039719 RepID=UPI0032EAC893